MCWLDPTHISGAGPLPCRRPGAFGCLTVRPWFIVVIHCCSFMLEYSNILGTYCCFSVRGPLPSREGLVVPLPRSLFLPALFSLTSKCSEPSYSCQTHTHTHTRSPVAVPPEAPGPVGVRGAMRPCGWMTGPRWRAASRPRGPRYRVLRVNPFLMTPGI